MPAWLAAILLFSPAWAGPSGAGSRDRELRQAVFDGRYLQALKLYAALDAAGQADGRDAYFAGWTELRLHRPDRARPLLEKARDAGWSPKGWKTAAELLSRAQDQLEALPPAAAVKGLDEALLQTYAEESDGLSGQILAAQPEFLRVGRAVFGGPPPALRVYLYATHQAMERLAQASGDQRTGRRGSTGGYGFVRLSSQDLTRPVEDDSVGLALHETTHAWMATYWRDRYDKPAVLPAYIDEGLANYVGGLWKFQARRERLRQERLKRVARWCAQNGAPPAFAMLRAYGSFHDEGRDMLDYDLATLLMERLLGPADRGASRIPALLDALARSDGDDAAAWKAVTGKDAAAEYAALTRELWSAAR